MQERIDFAELAAFRGIIAIQDAKSGFLRGDRLFWNGVDQVEIPFTRNRVAEFVCFGEVISRFEKKHRNRWDTFAEKMQDDHVFGLEAACEASAVRIGAGERLVDNFLSGARFEALQIVREAHQNAPLPGVVPSSFTRFAIRKASSKKSSGEDDDSLDVMSK